MRQELSQNLFSLWPFHARAKKPCLETIKPDLEGTPPIFTFDLIQLSIQASEKNEKMVSHFKKQALEKGADLALVEKAITRGRATALLDEM